VEPIMNTDTKLGTRTPDFAIRTKSMQEGIEDLYNRIHFNST
jgi:hypothetical protein